MNVKYNVKLLDEYWIGNYVELSVCGLIYGNCCPGISFKVLSSTRRPADAITVNVFIFSECFTSQGKIPTPTAPTFGLLSTDLYCPLRKAVIWIVTLGVLVSWIKTVCFRWPIYCLYQSRLPVFRPRFEHGTFWVQVNATTTRTNWVDFRGKDLTRFVTRQCMWTVRRSLPSDVVPSQIVLHLWLSIWSWLGLESRLGVGCLVLVFKANSS